jgi:hypothetical protein
MDESTEARLARLVERRRAPESPTSKPRRRRHAADASRVLAAGISASAFMGTITAFALSAQPKSALATRVEPTTVPEVRTARTIVHVRKIKRVIYVDEHGRPVGTQIVPPSQSATATRSAIGAAVRPASGATPGGATSTNTVVATPAPVQGVTPSNRVTAPPVTGGPVPPPVATAPVTTPPPPSPTAPPATVAPPSTSPAPPPPTTLPKCAGSKCP